MVHYSDFQLIGTIKSSEPLLKKPVDAPFSQTPGFNDNRSMLLLIELCHDLYTDESAKIIDEYIKGKLSPVINKNIERFNNKLEELRERQKRR